MTFFTVLIRKDTFKKGVQGFPSQQSRKGGSRVNCGKKKEKHFYFIQRGLKRLGNNIKRKGLRKIKCILFASVLTDEYFLKPKQIEGIHIFSEQSDRISFLLQYPWQGGLNVIITFSENMGDFLRGKKFMISILIVILFFATDFFRNGKIVGQLQKSRMT